VALADLSARRPGVMAAAIGGLDVLVFTRGVDAHAAPICDLATADLAFLDIAIDHAANSSAGDEADTTPLGSVSEPGCSGT
jgi:acetate kinase